MGTCCFFPSSGTAAVSPTPSADWSHISANSRPLEFTRGGSTLTSLTYSPDVADHLVSGDSMNCQFVSGEIMPPQVVAEQQIFCGFRANEVTAESNLFPCFKIYGCNVAGTTNLGNIVPFRRSAVLELATAPALTGVAEAMLSSAVTFNEAWRLVVEIGYGGTPVAGAGIDGHNGTIAWGSPLVTGALQLPQNGDTSACTPVLLFSNDLIRFTPIAPQAVVGQPQAWNQPMQGWRR